MKVLFISHEASRTGAALVLLYFLKWLRENSNVSFEILLKKDGEIRAEFEALAPVMIWDENTTLNGNECVTQISKRNYWIRKIQRRCGLDYLWQNIHAKRPVPSPPKRHIDHIRDHVKHADFDLIYSNTFTNGSILGALSGLDCPVICHVHELEWVIKYWPGWKNVKNIKRSTNRYIAVSQAVKENLIRNHKIPENIIDVVYEFIPTQSILEKRLGSDDIRKKLHLHEDAMIVGACGTTEWRKGPDLFVRVARVVHRWKKEKPVHYIWVGGDKKGGYVDEVMHDAKRAGLEKYMHFVGTSSTPLDYFNIFDVFVMVSREDPFPLVNLEAALLEKPIVCFDGSGGSKEFVEDCCGFVVPYLDTKAMGARVIDLLNSTKMRKRLGQRGAERVRQQHDVSFAAPLLFDIIEKHFR